MGNLTSEFMLSTLPLLSRLYSVDSLLLWTLFIVKCVRGSQSKLGPHLDSIKAGWMGPSRVYLEKFLKEISAHKFRLVKMIQGQGETQFYVEHYLWHSEIHAEILSGCGRREMGRHWWTTLTSGSTITFGPGRSNISSDRHLHSNHYFGGRHQPCWLVILVVSSQHREDENGRSPGVVKGFIWEAHCRPFPVDSKNNLRDIWVGLEELEHCCCSVTLFSLSSCA